MTDVFEYQGCRVSVDAQYLPIAISRWEGLLTPASARDALGMLGKIIADAHARGDKVWSVVDATKAQRPDALTRKLLTELTDEMEAGKDGTFQQPTFVVIDSAVVRGALTALNWLSGGRIKTEPCATLEAALTRALEEVIKAGLEEPPGLDPATYSPDAPVSKRA